MGKKRLIIFLCMGQALALWAGDKIPLLISDHHADHAGWLLRQSENEEVKLILVDAHSDTAINPAYHRIREHIAAGNYPAADAYLSNQNWIHPLIPKPVTALYWISKISEPPDRAKAQGFLTSTASWDMRKRDLGLHELDWEEELFSSVQSSNTTLFVSIDLDFFYQENYTSRDIPFVCDKLLAYSLRHKGTVLWGICLSYMWLPDDSYAMELLEKTMKWLAASGQFARPDITLLSSVRYDTSAKAEAWRAAGQEPPSFAAKRNALPDSVERLLERFP